MTDEQSTLLFGNDGDGLEITGDDNVVGGMAPEDERHRRQRKIAGTSADGVDHGDGNMVKELDRDGSPRDHRPDRQLEAVSGSTATEQGRRRVAGAAT